MKYFTPETSINIDWITQTCIDGKTDKIIYVTDDEYRAVQDWADELDNIVYDVQHIKRVEGVTDLSYERQNEARRRRYLEEDQRMYFISRLLLWSLGILLGISFIYYAIL